MADVKTAFNRKDALASSRKQDLNSANVGLPQNLGNYLRESKRGGENGGEEVNHVERLSNARRAGTNKRGTASEVKNAMQAAKKLAGAKAITSDLKAMTKEMNLLADMPFVAATGAALLKDVLDLVTFATVILPWIFSLLCGIFIFMMLLLAGASGKKKGAQRILNKLLLTLGGSIADGIPGLGLFPVETFTVIIIYVMTLKERVEDRKEAEAQEAERRRIAEMENNMAAQYA
jgi:hypothetical protein